MENMMEEIRIDCSRQTPEELALAVRPHMVSIGNNVIVMNGCLMMSAGGITIEDDARIAANTQIISNNHDPYNRDVITCKPVVSLTDECKGHVQVCGASRLRG